MGGTLIQPSATSWSTFRSLPVSREAAAVGVSDLARHHAADRLRQLALANRLDTSCRLPSLLQIHVESRNRFFQCLFDACGQPIEFL